jgi:tetratricopeptide (TPR) repeat protein
MLQLMIGMHIMNGVSQFGSRLIICGIVAMTVGAGALAMAQTPSAASVPSPASINSDDPLEHYRVYEAAVARRDMPAASDAANLAWRTGERVWPTGNPNLAGLAFNAAWALGLSNRIGEAQEPARRAVALAQQNPGSIDLNEARFLSAYADLMAKGTNLAAGDIEAFSEVAKTVENGGWGDYLLPNALFDASRALLAKNKPRLMRDLTERGLAEVVRLAPNDQNLRTNLLIIKTQAALQSRDFALAITDAMAARRTYGVPKTARDVNWASLLAWELATRAVYESIRGPDQATGSRVSARNRAPQWEEGEEQRLRNEPPECREFKIKRIGSGPTGIAFPIKESSDGFAGGAIIRASLDESGRVTNADVLAALPRPSFGTAAQQGIMNWRYEVPAGTPAQCRQADVTLVYAFQN